MTENSRLRTQQGFSLTELMVALGIAGVLGVSSMSFIESFQRSKATSLSKANQTDLRNLIYMALKDPTTCKSNVVTPLGTFAAIATPGTTVPVQIINSAGGGVSLVQDGENYQSTIYSVRLGGTISHTIAASPSHVATTVYHATITVVADRTKLGLGAAGSFAKAQIGGTTQTQSVPLTLELDAAGNLFSCSVDEPDVELVGGAHSVYDCNTAGGIPVVVNQPPAVLGRYCLIIPFNPPTTGSTATYCTAEGCTVAAAPNTCDCPSTTVTTTVPPCPSGPPTAMAAAAYGTPPSDTWDCQYASPPSGGCPNPWVVPAPNPTTGPYSWCQLNGQESDCTSAGGTYVPGPPPSCVKGGGCPSGSTLVGPDGSGGNYCAIAGSPGVAVTCPAGPPAWTPVTTQYTSVSAVTCK